MLPPAAKSRRADQGVRILTADTPAEVRHEIARVGCHADGVQIMLPKGLLRLVRLERVPVKAASVLKQEMLSHGGDAAVHCRTLGCDIEHTDVLLLGSEAQLMAVCRHLRRQPFGL